MFGLASTVSQDDVLEAVNLLIQSDCYPRLRREIEDIIQSWSATPRLFAGDLLPLNALVSLGITNRRAYGKVFPLVERKRRDRPEVRKADYQRDLMRERRARASKAIRLHELTTGRTLTSEERSQYEREAHARWAREKSAYMLKTGKVDWAGRQEATREFWERVDATLDKNLADAEKG